MWYQSEIAGSKFDRLQSVKKIKKNIAGERNCYARFQHTFGETQREVGSRRGLDENLKEDYSRGGLVR